MPVPYQNTGPVDSTVAIDTSTLKGKSVIVTGGSSGLGAAYVKAFANAGAYVTNADLQPGLDDTGLTASNYQFVKCDVRVWKEQVDVFKAAIEKSPSKSVDIVVANAGISGLDEVFQLDEGDEPIEPDLRIININYIGVVYSAKIAMHYFSKQPQGSDKCLILKSSLAGYLDLIGSPSYQTSKFAVRALMCNLRRTDRLRVNLIAPWFIATPLISAPVAQFMAVKFKEAGLAWALEEDSVKAVMRVATDNSINGRTLGVVSRDLAGEGYVDLEQDDYAKGSLLERLQNGGLAMTHRMLPKDQQ